MQIPHISKELIDFLKEMYPLRSPKMDETERSIFARAGHQQVINTLEKFHQEQVNYSLERSVLKKG